LGRNAIFDPRLRHVTPSDLEHGRRGFDPRRLQPMAERALEVLSRPAANVEDRGVLWQRAEKLVDHLVDLCPAIGEGGAEAAILKRSIFGLEPARDAMMVLDGNPADLFNARHCSSVRPLNDAGAVVLRLDPYANRSIP